MEPNQSAGATGAAEEKIPVTTEEIKEIPPGSEAEIEKQRGAEPVEISDEAALATFNKKFGKDFKSFDEIKFPEAEVSEEDKKREISAKEKKLFEVFAASGGNIDQFATIKNVANANVEEFSLADLKRELLAEGITADDIEAVIKERYYLLSDEEKESLDPTDPQDAAILKKNEIFSNKLKTMGESIIIESQSFMARLSADIEAADLLKATDAKISSTVDEYAKGMDRKIKLDLGKSNDIQLAPVEFNIEDAHIAETIKMLKDPVQRNNFLYKADGSENIENLIEALKWKDIAQSLAKKAAVEAANEQVAHFKTIFPNHTQAIVPGSVPRRGNTGVVGKVIEGTEKVAYQPTSR